MVIFLFGFFDAEKGNNSKVEIKNSPRRSLVEGDEQLDRPNSKTTMELCHACVFGYINARAF